jgi:hypothetical protein
MSHPSPFLEKLGVRCQADGSLAAIDGLLTWQEFEATIAAIVGGPVTLAERKVSVERDDERGTVVTFARLTDDSAALLRRFLSCPVNGQDC